MIFQTDNEFYNFRLAVYLISFLLVLLSISILIGTLVYYIVVFPTVFNSNNCSYINGTEVSYQ